MIVRKSNSNGSYINGLRELRALIMSENLCNGGWLPSEREMCLRCGLSNLTYRKALKHLQAEGVVVAYPRKGCYVHPQGIRMNKLGVVINDGERSPFWVGCTDMLIPLIQQIANRKYAVHQLQASSLRGVIDAAILNGVSGAFWYNPSEKALATFKEILQQEYPRFLVVRFHDPVSPDTAVIDNIPIVEADLTDIGAAWAYFLTSRGHRRILYVGTPWSANSIGLASALQKLDVPFSNEYCITGINSENTQYFLKKIRDLNVTAIIGEGAGIDAEETFRALSQITHDHQPEFVCRHHGFISELQGKYPKVRVVAVGKTDHSKVAVAAVDTMTAYLQEQTALASRKVRAFSIECIQ